MFYYSMMYSTFLFIFCSGEMIHEQMTPDEVRLVFLTDDEIPEYEVVSVGHAIHENSPKDSPHSILEIQSFKRDIRLYLEPTTGILADKKMPIWTVKGDRSSPYGLKYTLIPNVMQDLSDIHQDVDNQASLTSSYDEDGSILFEGTIGDDLLIRPLPPRLRKKESTSRGKREVRINEDSFPQSNRTVYHPSLRYTHRHIIFKNKNFLNDQFKISKMDFLASKAYNTLSKRSVDVDYPEIVYPQILVVVDYSEYLSLQTLEDVKRYVVSFWNAVDLRYRVFSKPAIRLNIAGIVVSTDPNGTPFIQNNRYRPNDGPNVDADKALDQMANYYYQEYNDTNLGRFVLERDYDIVVAMTSLNLCNKDAVNKNFDCATLGYAFHGKACTMNVKDRSMKSVGIIQDNGGYSGIVLAAHELGHIMGASHDGDREKNETSCQADEGYIMSYTVVLTDNIFKWSYCSIEHIQKFFRSKRAECLFNKPFKTEALPRLLPGKVFTLDEQCDRITGTYACNKNESVCARLDCYDPSSIYKCTSVAPAAEGSNCGVNRHCINGKCVDKRTKKVHLEVAQPPSHVDLWNERLNFSAITVEKSRIKKSELVESQIK